MLFYNTTLLVPRQEGKSISPLPGVWVSPVTAVTSRLQQK